jgi:hypothetical protein
MFLDYGRKALKGSPDLAIKILEKIESADVFVGDVTPVGKGAPYKTDEGIESDGKLLMNPNVAIELGYALKVLTTEKVLMVMNRHYGKRADLPFDLGHKGGPISYNLGPSASKAEIDKEKKRLVAVLKEALVEYAPKPIVELFPEMKPKIGDGIYFERGEILGESSNNLNKENYIMPFRDVMWLRVIPSVKLQIPLSFHTLLQHVGAFGSFGISMYDPLARKNNYGVAFFTPAGNTTNIDEISQYSPYGEIWGVDADILRQGENGLHKYLYSLPMENLFITSLDLYIQFMQQISQVPPPVEVEAGICGIRGRAIAHNGGVIQSVNVMHEDSVTYRTSLKSFDKSAQGEILLEFFRRVNNNTGVARPIGLYGRG